MRIVKKNRFKNLGELHKEWTEAGVKASRAPHTDVSRNLATVVIRGVLSPAHTVRFWPRFGHLGQILKILKDSCNPRLKSVVFDRWFDMSTDSRLMAVAINFFLRLNSGSVRRFQTLSCSVTSPTTTVKPRTNRCAEPDDESGGQYNRKKNLLSYGGKRSTCMTCRRSSTMTGLKRKRLGER